ncbi:MAG: hypothetical protein ACREQ9_20050 [Candidatus Binatia bacterium]
MKRYEFVVLSNPQDGRDDEYNEWYDRRHLADVLAVPGLVAARRFRLAKPDGKRHRYLALYEIETADLGATLKDLYGRIGSASMPISEAIDMDGVDATVYEAITERIEKKR